MQMRASLFGQAALSYLLLGSNALSGSNALADPSLTTLTLAAPFSDLTKYINAFVDVKRITVTYKPKP